MFTLLQRFLGKRPASLEESLWNYVSLGLTSDAKLLEGLLQLSGHLAQGGWSRMKLESDIACFRITMGASIAAANDLNVARKLASYAQEKLRARIVTKHAATLSIFAAFSQLSTTAAVERLLSRCAYHSMIGEALNSPLLKEPDLIRVVTESFWAGLILSYSGNETNDSLAMSGDRVRGFIPRYVSSQVQGALAIRSKLKT